MRTTTSWALWFNGEVARAGRGAWEELMRAYAGGPGSTELWLYFKRGELRFANACPEGFQLGCAERLPGDMTVAQTIAWTHQRATRLECLPE